MSQLVESIRLENQRLDNLEEHQARFDRTRAALFPSSPKISLSERVKISDAYSKGLFKCRVLYQEEIEGIEFIPYSLPKIQTLKLVKADDIMYSHKYVQRDALTQLFQRRARGDDILMIKAGRITDSYYANVALKEGGNWYTPSFPLLKGTRRASLVNLGKVFLRDIKVSELFQYQKIKLVNALLNWEDAPEIEINPENILV